jgi:putative heme transporter
VILLKYLANAACLIVALRAVGVPRDALTIAGAFAAYSVVRLVTVVEITPGGVGVVEVAYTAALTYVTGDAYHAEIVAGVLLFRVVTYIAPIATGAIAYVVWRMKKSWRVDVPPDEPGDLEFVSVLVDESPPRE